ARAVGEVCGPGALGEEIDHVDDVAARGAEEWFELLAEHHWRFEVHRHQARCELWIALDFVERAGQIERRVVNQRIEPLCAERVELATDVLGRGGWMSKIG